MEETSRNFIEQFVSEDIAPGGRFEGRQVHTRFPPEPNGYLHIGHCKALIIDFGTAERFGGICNLRMDDTNPAKEDTEYVDAIKEDIHWLGFDWGDRFFYGSDYFEQTYEYAEELIKKGLAYVCELTPEQFREYRGDVSTPARSPWRDRPVEESLDLFRRMRAGEFPDNKYTLRAKIDLASGNFNMRDPVIYRIRHFEHHRQGNKWCIYPMYDFAHPIQDALEGINALALLAGVRGAQAPLRLGGQQRLRTQPAAPDRVCAPGDKLHRHEQAQAAPPGRGGLRLRLGRPAYAHALRASPPGLHPRRHTRVHNPRRRRQGQLHGRVRAFGELPARRPQRPRPARHGRAASAQADDSQLPRGQERADRGREQPQRPGGRHPHGELLAQSLHRARGLHGAPRAEV